MPDKAVIFIDGNNWFHSLQDIDVDDRGRLNYKKISEKLLGPRVWLGTRYYIGRMTQALSPSLYAQQRSFLAQLERTDKRMILLPKPWFADWLKQIGAVPSRRRRNAG